MILPFLVAVLSVRWLDKCKRVYF